MPFVSASAISPYNDIRGGAEGGVTGTLLLDLYPGAAAAYSLRQLRTAYTGPAIQVRRSSDDTLQDIGFVDGNLDTASLLSFVGSGNGFVKTWYDQSGQGNDASQASTAAQPKVVSSGVVVLENGKAAIEFDGTNDFFDATSVTTGNPKSIFISSKFASVTASEKVIFDSTTTNQSILYKGTNNNIALGFGTFTFTSYTATTDYVLYSILHNGTNSNAFINSGQILTNTNLGTNAFNGLRIGAVRGTANLFYNGIISEFIVYGLDESANRRGIEININNYYSIYPTALDFNPYNIWDSEHISINNTTTTFTDFNTVGTTYDLVNPAASNQPAYTSSDSSFRGLPSITFDGAGEYVSNAVSSYRVGDSSGMYIGVFKYNSGGNFNFFTSASDTNNGIFIRQARFPAASQYIHRLGGGTSIFQTIQSNIIAGDVTIQALAGDGTNFIAYSQDGVITATQSGTYKWFNEVANRTNISIGASLNPAIRYADITWCMSGYFPYVDDATTESLITALKNKYIDAPIPVDPILAFNPTNVWDSEHVIVNGTETTFVDFNNSGEGNYDLTNPAATNQPAYIFSDADFNNLPSFDFDGIDNYVVGTAANYRNSDDSGAFISVYKLDSLTRLSSMMVSSSASNNSIGFAIIATNTYRFVVPSRQWRGSTNINNTTTSYAVANVSTGSSYKQWINETPQTVAMLQEQMTVLFGQM